MTEKRNSRFDKTVQRLKDKYIGMMRDGLGREGLSPGEEQDVVAFIENATAEVFKLYAGLEVAKSLNIENEYRRAAGIALPEDADIEKDEE